MGEFHCETSPESSRPYQMTDEIALVLSSISGVQTIALFGSLAEGRSDQWSDVDMVVGCEDVETTMWLAADAIRRAKPVLFYRMFSIGEQPSGRYWFTGESPFHKLDVSFESVEDYGRCLETQIHCGHKVRARQLYSSASVYEAGIMHARPNCLALTERETEIGRLIYHTLCSLKYHFRGKEELTESSPYVRELREALMSLPRETTTACGNLGELAHRTYEMVANLLEEPSNSQAATG